LNRGGNDPIGYGEFRDWATKEWAVYIGKISVLREEASVCFLKHGPIAQYKCQEQIREYLRHANKQNLFEAKRYACYNICTNSVQKTYVRTKISRIKITGVEQEILCLITTFHVQFTAAALIH
jgi:hypothetical protein